MQQQEWELFVGERNCRVGRDGEEQLGGGAYYFAWRSYRRIRR